MHRRRRSAIDHLRAGPAALLSKSDLWLLFPAAVDRPVVREHCAPARRPRAAKGGAGLNAVVEAEIQAKFAWLPRLNLERDAVRLPPTSRPSRVVAIVPGPSCNDSRFHATNWRAICFRPRCS